MQYRIKQIDENIFIPQCRKYWLDEWESLDNELNFTWIIKVSYAHHDSYEKALNTIERYKKYLKEKNKYPKYYKVL